MPFQWTSTDVYFRLAVSIMTLKKWFSVVNLFLTKKNPLNPSLIIQFLAATEMISNPDSFNAFNAAAALGHLRSRKDYYARINLTFLVVFSLLFGAFNVCYWISLFFWIVDEENHLQSE